MKQYKGYTYYKNKDGNYDTIVNGYCVVFNKKENIKPFIDNFIKKQ